MNSNNFDAHNNVIRSHLTQTRVIQVQNRVFHVGQLVRRPT